MGRIWKWKSRHHDAEGKLNPHLDVGRHPREGGGHAFGCYQLGKAKRNRKYGPRPAAFAKLGRDPSGPTTRKPHRALPNDAPTRLSGTAKYIAVTSR